MEFVWGHPIATLETQNMLEILEWEKNPAEIVSKTFM